MKRKAAVLFISLFAFTAQASARDVSIVSESETSVSSTIIQTTPGENAIELHMRAGPGYVIIRQRGSNGESMTIRNLQPDRN